MTIEGIICSTVDGDWSHKIKICLLLGRKAITNLDSRLKSRNITLMTKIHIVKGVVLPVSCTDVRVKPQRRKKKAEEPRNWYFWIVVLEKTLESPLDSKEIKPVNLKGNLPWKLTGRTDAEAEAPGFWSPDTNSRLTGKIPDAGKDWGQKEEKASEDEVAGWHHWCNGHELRQTSGDGEEQGGLVCYRVSGGCKESVIKQQQQHIEPKTSEHHFQILLLLYTYQEKKNTDFYIYLFLLVLLEINLPSQSCLTLSQFPYMVIYWTLHCPKLSVPVLC